MVSPTRIQVELVSSWTNIVFLGQVLGDRRTFPLYPVDVLLGNRSRKVVVKGNEDGNWEVGKV